MTRLVEGVPDGALRRPTPCARYSVGDLLDHIGGFAIAFAAAARKMALESANLAEDRRERIPA